MLSLVADGHRQQEIAERLFIEVGTVHTHMRDIRSVLNVCSAAGAVAKAIRHGWID